MRVHRAVLLCAALCVSSGTAAEWPKTIEVSGTRPLYSGLRKVEELSGRVVTYEEPEQPSLEPGRISVTVEVPGDAGRLVDAMVKAWSDDTHRFVQWTSADGKATHVAVSGVPGADGGLVSSTPLLDTRITLPPGKTDPRTFLRDLCDAISKARHTKLIPFTLNAPGLRGRRVFAGAKDEVARDVLASYLAAIDPQISWSVLCEPHVTCGLNLHRVAPRPAR